LRERKREVREGEKGQRDIERERVRKRERERTRANLCPGRDEMQAMRRPVFIWSATP
jgi:hypothetical protein